MKVQILTDHLYLLSMSALSCRVRVGYICWLTPH